MATIIEITEADVLITDNELLGRYHFQDDDVALEELVRRHAGLVMGVCRKMLFHSHDAEDAFQATFLILSRKSKSLINHGSIAGWLYQTALRNCLQIRRRKGRAREIEMIEEPIGIEEPWRTISQAQESDLIYQEINRLPKRYRDVIVMCHLQGHTRSEAAEFLDWTDASVKAALSRGRNMLRRRLIRSGLMTSTAIGMLRAATVDAQEVITEPLVTSTLQICQGITPTVSVGSGANIVQSLSTHGVLSMHTATIIKSIALAASVVFAISIPLVLLAQEPIVGGDSETIDSSPNSVLSADEIPAASIVTVARIQNDSHLTPAEAFNDYLKLLVGLRTDGAVSNVTDETTDLVAPDSSDDQTSRKNGLDRYSTKDSKEYWELMLKSFTTRIQALENQPTLGIAKSDQLEMLSEKYETQAKAVEARLNLKRIKAAEAEQADPAQLRDDSMPDANEMPQKLGAIRRDRIEAVVVKVQSDEELIAVTVGSDDGIRVGQLLKIYRAEKFIGTADVVKTESDLSAARLRSLGLTDQVKEGDQVLAFLGNSNGDPDQAPTNQPDNLRQKIEAATEVANSSNQLADANRSLPDKKRVIPPASTAAIGPGEALLVESESKFEFGRRVVVQADHTISLPLVGTISVKGMTTQQVAEVLNAEFSKFAKNPNMFVVRESASTPLPTRR